MPTGPRVERRPADVRGSAIMVARLSVYDISEPLKEASGRVRIEKAGAKAGATNLKAQERRKIAMKATGTRWG
jgi:hypothetical protein